MQVGSVTELDDSHCGQHALVGSHGGRATGAYAAQIGLASLICHDAGIGLEGAGVAALYALDRTGVPACAVGHNSARVGDPDDMVANGTVSAVNAAARALGVCEGLPVSRARELLSTGRVRTSTVTSVGAVSFRSSDIVCNGHKVVLHDSASSISSRDTGEIIVTGSHGGMPGGDAARAVKAVVALVFFNDAGLGKDGAGIARLAVLASQGIPVAAVDCMSARIGDAASTLETGVLSHVNAPAERAGLAPGQSVDTAISTFVDKRVAVS